MELACSTGETGKLIYFPYVDSSWGNPWVGLGFISISECCDSQIVQYEYYVFFVTLG